MHYLYDQVIPMVLFFAHPPASTPAKDSPRLLPLAQQLHQPECMLEGTKLMHLTLPPVMHKATHESAAVAHCRSQESGHTGFICVTTSRSLHEDARLGNGQSGQDGFN